MKYLIEQFKWEDKKYYHLVNSRIFESDIPIKERSYSKGSSYFNLIKLEDETKTTGRKRG